MTKGMKPGWRNRLRREGSGCKMTSSEGCVSADDTSGGGFRQAVVQVTVLSHHPGADGGGVADGGFVVSETQC